MQDKPDPLARYRSMRDFERSPEPSGQPGAAGPTGAAPADRNSAQEPAPALAYVIQKHAATRLHYDFRLEWGGVMLSWALPKGPSHDPRDKRIAIQVEDHPIAYNRFEGTIPPGQYGAGTVIVWDCGHWAPVGDPGAGLAAGKLLFDLHGQKLGGRWELVRIAKPGERQTAWILFKKPDAWQRPRSEYDVVSARPDSVLSGPGAAIGPPGGRGPAAISPAPTGEGSLDPARLSQAIAAALPARIGPQLASLGAGLPVTGDWIYEVKLDGYRLMARIEAGRPCLFTRGGIDWTSRLPGLAAQLSGLGLDSAWLDGEIVVFGADGKPDFGALQNAFDSRDSERIVYFLFDLPYLEGFDLRATPLRERRALLRRLLTARPCERIGFSVDFDAEPARILESALRLKLEGLMAKRADAPYRSQRTDSWLKLKFRQRQEFVVAGYTDRGADPGAAEIGSLVLGVHDGAGRLLAAGGVGSGWDAATAAALKRRLAALRGPGPPFAALDQAAPAAKGGRQALRRGAEVIWVKPRLVVELSFAGWTPQGRVRHAVFEGLREDKPAREVVREQLVMRGPVMPLTSASVNSSTSARSARSGASPASTSAATASPSAVRTARPTRVSHPERVIDPSTGLTKLDLIRYYQSVADRMLPHLTGRPCSLVRGPQGVAGKLFFQKHPATLQIAELRALDASLWPGHEPLIEVPDTTALLAAAQMNVIEFHTWNAKIRAFERPDRMIFDLDPGEGVAWRRVQEAAALIRSFLGDLGLKAWLKTSGGKGLHLVVPLAPRQGWDTVRAVSKAIVAHLARQIPDRFVARSGAEHRVGRIFVDGGRNAQGATTVAAYSARARPGLGVSMPVGWEQLDALKGGAHWTIATAREHLSFQTADPWADYARCRQTPTRAIKLLAIEMSG